MTFDMKCHSRLRDTQLHCELRYGHHGACRSGEMAWSESESYLCRDHPYHYPGVMNPAFVESSTGPVTARYLAARVLHDAAMDSPVVVDVLRSLAEHVTKPTPGLLKQMAEEIESDHLGELTDLLED